MKKITRKEELKEHKWFMSGDQPEFKYFDDFRLHMELRQLEKDWAEAKTFKDELKATTAMKKLLTTLGNKNAIERLKWVEGEIEFANKHMKGDK